VLARTTKGYTDVFKLGKKIVTEYREYLLEPPKKDRNGDLKPPVPLEKFINNLRLYHFEPDNDQPAKIMRKGTIWKLLNDIPELRPEITKAMLKGGV